ncbi:MAG: alpha/beta fold hydrolase [Microcystaceae cyanobacterium]
MMLDPRITEFFSLDLLTHLARSPITVPLPGGQIETTSPGIMTSYVQRGEGKSPILLLHGFDSSVLEFRRLLPRLAVTKQTWAVDLLGFGFSERSPFYPTSAITIKQHLYQTWKTLIQEPIILVGVSMGGAAALDFTLTYPDLVQKLVLIDSAGLTKPPLATKVMFPPLDSWVTNILANPSIRQNISRAAYYDKSLASPDAQACAALHLSCDRWQESLIEFTKSGGYGSFLKLLPQLTLPTLILWGKQDKILGTKAAHQFKQFIPNSQLVWLDHCGHVPHLEQPEQTAEAILSFL